MRLPPALALAAAAAALLAPGPGAEGGDGFLMRRAFRSVDGEASGGMELWLRDASGLRTVQNFTVWFRGAAEVETAVLYMAAAGGSDFEEVASIPIALAQDEETVSGYLSFRLDSSYENNPSLPLEAEDVLHLQGARVQVRVTTVDDPEEQTILWGKVGEFRFREIEGRSRAGVRSRKTTLEIADGSPEEEGASAMLRAFRGRDRGTGDSFQGFSVFATGLEEDGEYEVWVATSDAGGSPLELVGTFTTLAEAGPPLNPGYFLFDSRYGDTYPVALAADDARDLFGRRVEVRRSGFAEASLVGFFPRLR